MSNENKVHLLGYYGGDKTHALAAWSSTFLELDIPIPEKIEDRVDCIVDYIISNSKRIRSAEQLLNFLAKEKHTSPFRFSTLHFATTTDISTHIQFLKHSVALSAENAESARYKELKEDKFYLPKDWEGIEVEENVCFCGEEIFASGKENAWINDEWLEVLDRYVRLGNRLYHQALKDLTPKLGRQRAKETARFFKTYNSQINSSKMMSFDGFLQIYFKRNLKSPSQREIAYVVEDMLQEIKNINGSPFKHSLSAFGL